MILYTVTNLASGKRYVGQTRHLLSRRAREHRLEAERGSRTALHCAIRLYGFDLFLFEQVASSWSTRSLKQAERELIAQEGTQSPGGYNLTLGGDGFSGRHQPSTIRKMKRSQRRARDRETQWERDWRAAAISNAKRGKSQPWAAGATHNKGRVRSPEFKQAISGGMKRYTQTLPPGEMARRAGRPPPAEVTRPQAK